jgi:hypothetical protein
MTACDARFDFGDGEFARIKRQVFIEQSPDQTDAGFRFRRLIDRVRPAAVDHVDIDIFHATIRIDVASRKFSAHERCAKLGRIAEEVIDIGVFGLPKHREIAGVIEIARIANAAVGRIEHEGNRGDAGGRHDDANGVESKAWGGHPRRIGENRMSDE